jgi:tagatose-1,6-bisphosphate aldolase non-catalytic subunit AgaZ/GatZ
MPLFVVGQTGTLTRLTSNVGHYDTPTATNLSNITHKYGTGLKEHNGDYLCNEILLEHPVIGLDAMNVAPEFGLVETEALLDLCSIEEKFLAPAEQSNLRAVLAEHAVKGERWRKWMVGEKRTTSIEEIMKDEENVKLITSMCGHYTLEDKEVKEALALLNANITKLGLDPEFYVIKKIKDSIDRYIYCFGLYGTTSALVAAAK